ncbi:MAG: DUF1428 domain-containing protein [Novosphingobium sp.]
MSYVDGFLIPVPEAHKDEYVRMAQVAAQVFADHGAVHISENWGDDLIRGETTDFYMAVKAEPGENVVFSWITWPSKEARDAGNKAAMADPRFDEFAANKIFNGKRMIFSGFQNLLEVRP